MNRNTPNAIVRSACFLMVSFCGINASADTLINQGLDPSFAYGWRSEEGHQVVAERFSTTGASTLTNISWFGTDDFTGSASLDIDIVFYADNSGLPNATALASYSFLGLIGIDTGLMASGMHHNWFEWSTGLPMTLLGGPADYWVSIKGASGSGFTWAHGPTSGDGDTAMRFYSDPWHHQGTYNRDTQAVRIDANIDSVPEVTNTMLMLGLTLVVMAFARFRRSVA